MPGDPQTFANFGNALSSFISGMRDPNGGDDTPGASAPTFAQRLRAGAQAASEGYDQFLQQHKQLNLAGKSADYMFKSLGDDAPKITGITPEEWANKGSADKVAAMKSLMEQQTLNEMRAKVATAQKQGQMYAERGNLYRSQADQRNADLTADQNFAGMLNGGDAGGGSSADAAALDVLGRNPGGPGAPGGGTLAQRLLAGGAPTNGTGTSGQTPFGLVQMMLRAGIRPDVAIGRAPGLAALMKGGGANGRQPGDFFDASPDQMAQDVPGFPGLKRIITGPKTSVLRDASGNMAVPTEDEDGNVIGYSVSTGQGTAKFVPRKDTQPRGEVTDVDKFKATAQSHAAKVRAAAQAMQFMVPTSPGYQEKLGAYNQALQEQEDFLSGRQATAGQSLTVDQARTYLQKAGGDKDKARALAKKDGYSF